MERLVETALGQAGDFVAAQRWRRAMRDLAQGLRVGVLGLDPTSVRQVADRIAGTESVTVVVLDADPDNDDGSLLGVHALVWATPASAPLSASERSAMIALGDTRPQAAIVVLAGVELLTRMSDAPADEERAVRARVAHERPDGWQAPDGLETWVSALVTDHVAVNKARRRHVAQVLLRDARAHTVLTLAQLAHEERTLREDVAQRAQQLADGREQAQQTAAHVISSLQRHTQALMSEHSAFIYQLETALPEELASVAGRDDLANGVASWLVHVLDTWTTVALARWTDAVREDLDGIATEDWVTSLHLILPPHSEPSLNPATTWTHRLVVSGALAGGIALTLAGQWIPGIGLASGGAAIAALRALRGPMTTERVEVAAREALRHMAREAQATVQEREAELTRRAEQLVHSETASLQDAVDASRTALQDTADRLHERRAEMDRARTVLDARLAAMEDAS